MSDDDSQYLASNFLKKKDEDSQYLASNFKKKEKPSSWFEQNAQGAQEYINEPIEAVGRSVRDVAGGFGQGLANIVPGLANLGVSGINALLPNRSNGKGLIPHTPMFDVVPHGPSATMGEIGSFFTPGTFLKMLSKAPAFMHTTRAAMKIPMIAESIKHASNILGKSPTASKIAGNALLGGAYAPENPLLGMGLGAAGGAAGEAIGQLANKGYKGIKTSVQNNEKIKNTLQNFRPAAHAKEIEKMLSGGTNNITKNSRQLAADIRNAHNMREEEAGIFYNHALKNAGKEPIYGVGHRDIFPGKVPGYSKQQDTLSKIENLKVGDSAEHFKSNPTFANAHKLQSELGSMERKLQNSQLKINDPQNYRIELGKIKSAKRNVQEDITKFLEKRDSTSNMPVGSHYKKGSELFEANVAPFLSNKKLTDIVKEGKTDIKDLHTIFNTPTNKITKDGVEKIGSINKIMQDLPESAKERIIFNAIGGNKLSPEALMKKLEEIKSKGFESYFSPELEESINALGKKLKNTKRLKIGAGLVSAYGGAKMLNSLANNIL
jgi:hypothetical protein